MASVPTAHLIIFIAAIIVSAGIAGVIVEGAEQYGESVGEAQSAYAKDVSTEIAIINDAGKPSGSYDEAGDTLTLYVKNVGGRIIPAESSQFSVLVNGTAHAVSAVTVHGDTRWRPGVVVELSVSVVLPSNSETRVVVVVSGDRARYTFTSP
jgi:flagellar protein FlaG